MWQKAEKVRFEEITEFPEKKVKFIMGMKISYTDIGQGPILVCLPPWPSSSYAYYPLALALKGHFRVIALDLPGWGGDSGAMKLPPTIEVYGKIIKEFIKSFNFDEYYLIGYSFGGIFSLELSKENLIPPKKQVFVSTLHRGKDLYAKHRRYLNLAKRAIDLRIPEKIAMKITAIIFLKLMHSDNIYLKKYKGTKGLQKLMEEDVKANFHSIIQTLLSLMKYDVLTDYVNPEETIVLYAADDEPFIRTGSREIAERIGIEPILLENTNHDHLFFDVNKSADIILNFLLA